MTKLPAASQPYVTPISRLLPYIVYGDVYSGLPAAVGNETIMQPAEFTIVT